MIDYAKITKACEKCGKEYSKTPSYSVTAWAKRRFCSPACWKNDEKACLACGKIFRPRGRIQKHKAQYCSISCSKKGKIPPNLLIAQAASPVKKGNQIARCLKGRKRPKYSDEWLANMRYAFAHTRVNHSGKSHWNWKGGITPENMALRHRSDYTAWRKAVYARDRWTCQDCGIHCKPGNIVAHHIRGFKEYPELRYEPDNGITFCRKCHAALHQCLTEAA
jgi:hypothetical protein